MRGAAPRRQIRPINQQDQSFEDERTKWSASRFGKLQSGEGNYARPRRRLNNAKRQAVRVARCPLADVLHPPPPLPHALAGGVSHTDEAAAGLAPRKTCRH
jgi:hypothetical protein